MKKGISMILAVLLALAMLAGCSGTTASSTDTPSQTASEGSSSAEETGNFNKTGLPIVNEPITYTAMNAVADQVSSGKWDDLAYFTKMTELTNISFEFSNTPVADWETKMNLNLAGNELYDVYFGSVNSDNIRTYGVEAGRFLKLDEYLDYMPELTARNEENPLFFKSVTESDGHIYSYPAFVETATIAVATIYTRLDYTEKVGYNLDKINSLETVDEVYELLKAVQADNAANGEFVTLLPYSTIHLNGVVENYFFPAFGDDAYTGFYSADGKTVTNNWTSDQMKRYLEFMHKLYEEKILYQETYTADTATTTAITKANNAAFMSYGTMLGYDNFESGEFDMTILPLVTSEYTDTKKCQGYLGVSNSGRVISADCENPEALIRYLDLNYSKEDFAEGMNGLSNWLGVRGENWDYTDDTKEFYTVIIPDGVDLSATEYIYSFLGPSIHSYCSNMAIQQGSSPGLTCKVVESLEKLYPYHVTPFPLSMLKFTSDESSDYTTLYTEISEKVATMKAQFITGAADIETQWDAYVAEVEAMGMSELLELVQTAYDRYNAA